MHRHGVGAAQGRRRGTRRVDDGRGFDPGALKSTPETAHFGLSLMSDAARDAGAVLQVASALGHGTHWRLVVPRGSGEAQ
jgi:nitrate/nitrite-specific signal transduction histidine kinase